MLRFDLKNSSLASTPTPNPAPTPLAADGAFYRLAPAKDDLPGPSRWSRWTERLLGAGLALAVGGMTILTARLLTSPGQTVSRRAADVTIAPMGRPVPFEAPPEGSLAPEAGFFADDGDAEVASEAGEQQASSRKPDKLSAKLLGFSTALASATDLSEAAALSFGASDYRQAWVTAPDPATLAILAEPLPRQRFGLPGAERRSPLEQRFAFFARNGEENLAFGGAGTFFGGGAAGAERLGGAEIGQFAALGADDPTTPAPPPGAAAVAPLSAPPWRDVRPMQAPMLADEPFFFDPQSGAGWLTPSPNGESASDMTLFQLPAARPGGVLDDNALAAGGAEGMSSLQLNPALVPEPGSCRLAGAALVVAAVLAAGRRGRQRRVTDAVN